MTRTLVIVNPRSAGGRTGDRWPQLREILHEAYGAFEAKTTSAPGEATTLTREGLKEGFERVLAMGGDGTINEVVNGFFDGEKPVRPEAAFGLLPAGSGGDFRKTIATPKDFGEAARRLREALPRPIDVGRLRYIGADGAPGERRFVNIASFGLSGLVDRLVNSSSKPLGGTIAFATATLRATLAYRAPAVRLSLDGGPAREGRINTVAVANGRYFGSGMKVAPHAELDDGQFDVVTMGELSKMDVLLRGLDIYSGKHLSHTNVSVHRARHVEAAPVEGDEVLLDVDGEQPGRLPATFDLLPGAVNVLA
jgi:YegS/Rv2252/BmrU family lipid kinase